jgi:hypothetical protein
MKPYFPTAYENICNLPRIRDGILTTQFSPLGRHLLTLWVVAVAVAPILSEQSHLNGRYCVAQILLYKYTINK